jgi:hypothetical protein
MPDPSKIHAVRNTKWSLAGAVAAAVGASVCCLGPLLLLVLVGRDCLFPAIMG